VLLAVGGLAGSIGCSPAASRPPGAAPTLAHAIGVDAVPVPLDSSNPSASAIGDFVYAGGLALTSSQTDQLHGLSDLEVTGTDTLTVVGDMGVFVEARLVFDGAGRLAGLADTRLTLLTDESGNVLADKEDADAEGLGLLPNGDRLVSFERRHRVWLYPADGGPPRPVPSPDVPLPSNGGLEALAVDLEAGSDAYVVGVEDTGETWTCRVSASCVLAPPVAKAEEFGLVSMKRLPGMRTVHLLRAFDVARGSRISQQMFRSNTLIARMDMAAPLTVDNFEGVAAVPRPDGGVRFYLLSDDNGNASQRTLLLAFDWQPR
jgi:hypothetical protein